MTLEEIRELRAGDQIVVRFSTFGQQLAEVQGTALPSGRLHVRKYRAKSGRWTGIVAVSPEQIIGRATS